jgi:hypothetical protein
VNVIEEKGARLDLIQKTSFLLINEPLFCLLYFLREVNRPITTHTLARDLGSDEHLIIDHLQVLVTQGLVRSEAAKFCISEIGRQAVQIAEEGVGNKPYVFAAPAIASDCSEIEIAGFFEAGSDGDSLQLSLDVVFEDVLSASKPLTNERLKTQDRSASAEKTEILANPNRSEVADTDPSIVDQYHHLVHTHKDAANILNNL